MRDWRLETGDRRRNIRSVLFIAFLSAVCSLQSPVSYAEMTFEEAEEKAAELHKVAASDMIYQQEEWKAIYYQNIQIIKLLQDVRDELELLNTRAAKNEQKI